MGVAGTGKPSIVWLRDDLRLADNPALVAACKAKAPLIVAYVHDEESAGLRALGGATRWWLYYALASLNADLSRRGQTLVLRKGAAAKVMPALAREAGAATVFWNRRHGPGASVDERVTAALRRSNIETRTFDANLLYPPDTIRTKSGGSFRVFSAFWRTALANGEPRTPLRTPARLPPPVAMKSVALDALRLRPAGYDWANDIRATWQPGEAGAHHRLARFAERMAGYASQRDRPAGGPTSSLSPHLRFGEISPYQVWHAIGDVGAGRAKFLAEIGWREFAWHLFAHHPDLATRNLKPAFDAFAWGEQFADDIWAWRRGRTGYPIVDAGMRQLWQIGWMHNRARMIAASFLVKHLLADWRIGEEWFWDTLVDADPASNPVNWQWVAGTRADAQPFFRIFNPVLQGEKFDPQGTYVRRYVPELAQLPDRYIHRPWQAPDRVLVAAGVDLGGAYPLPIVDHTEARQRALAAFARMKERQAS
jgi:deoxyribodipyrimidine photo-lyase